ncbi:hypothetical protein [Catellatospora tritici]|uniref:hypothetical protein n=1 Tax=Catellatospora tritici TaxID=2851566 RepID=UPI001C2D8424|nr:hypothetical protein [Catellatospora tritici]MBV1855818.1 hypothetical protein [Catellatospora tritici]
MKITERAARAAAALAAITAASLPAGCGSDEPSAAPPAPPAAGTAPIVSDPAPPPPPAAPAALVGDWLDNAGIDVLTWHFSSDGGFTFASSFAACEGYLEFSAGGGFAVHPTRGASDSVTACREGTSYRWRVSGGTLTLVDQHGRSIEYARD